MENGIRSWKGLVAEGGPESGMAYFSGAEKPETLMALAWYLEDGSRKFYLEMVSVLKEEEARRLYHDLTQAEEHHKASLLALYKESPAAKPGTAFPESVLPPGDQGEVIEGGVPLREALAWVSDKPLTDVLEFSLALETGAYDLYLRMADRMKDQESVKVFQMLAREEKDHLQRLSAMLEKNV